MLRRDQVKLHHLWVEISIEKESGAIDPIKVQRSQSKMPLVPKSSYYDKNYKQSAALIRARRPYLVKNALNGCWHFRIRSWGFRFHY
ncbi:hypothetical protein EYC84_005356 [Monilinia fructicola]|uniref:Uncharacterized protein n=1 Tax=Monilinia fructicola TaxID=38448 RepID=A0A5M9JYR5_MONFR|nr:hypothetical protein EYC84_005356 [Monilinia fructicola]